MNTTQSNVLNIDGGASLNPEVDRNRMIGALQAFRANGAHHDSAAGQAALDKVMAEVERYASTCVARWVCA